MARAHDTSIVDVSNQLSEECTELGDAAADSIFADLPSYAGVDRGSVRLSVARNIRRAIETLQAGSAPSPETAGEAATTTVERAGQGVPIEDIIRGYRISLRVIHDRFLEIADEHGLDAQQILRSSNLLWNLGDWFVASAAVAYRGFAVDEAVRESVRRADWMNALLAGDLTASQAASTVRALGLDPDLRLRVFYVVPAGNVTPDQVRRSVEAMADTTTTVVEGNRHWRGLTTAPGPLVITDAVAALGPEVAFLELPESDRLAARVLKVMPRTEPGCFRFEDLSWRLAIDAEPALTAHLRRKYIESVEPLGQFGAQLLESVHAYLVNHLNVTRAARALFVHPNTQRYRMDKYERHVGVSLASVSTIAELAWVLDLPIEHTTTPTD
ncbi:helix-turn-helix domain-containing protein [Sphaerisporangium sp. NPDC051011]|uniref:PucR family transcriptional regulator n=1 Tax=Sphaerisporangium sp. NPDC051011 TaxID=3155792 RepID=UPI0033C7FFEB